MLALHAIEHYRRTYHQLKNQQEQSYSATTMIARIPVIVGIRNPREEEKNQQQYH
jgi:hypothetical protein